MSEYGLVLTVDCSRCLLHIVAPEIREAQTVLTSDLLAKDIGEVSVGCQHYSNAAFRL